MSNGNPAEIVRLVTLLQGESEVTWDEVLACLEGFPGWQQVVETLRDYTPTAGNIPLRAQYIPFEETMIVLGSKREHLRNLFQPYALLLDSQQTPTERARLLRQNGVDVEAFCEECLQHESAVITTAAQAVLEANEADTTLLRVTQDGVTPTDGLLHPTEAPSSVPPPHKSGLLQRLFGKHPDRKEPPN
jgi:hypothetical protein